MFPNILSPMSVTNLLPQTGHPMQLTLFPSAKGTPVAAWATSQLHPRPLPASGLWRDCWPMRGLVPPSLPVQRPTGQDSFSKSHTQIPEQFSFLRDFQNMSQDISVPCVWGPPRPILEALLGKVACRGCDTATPGQPSSPGPTRTFCELKKLLL